MLIFEKQFRNDSCEDIIESAKEADEYDFNEASQRLFMQVVDKTEELDEIIGELSPRRKVSRIGKVSLAVLRLAVYECLYEESVPDNVAVSEAVNIMNKYAFEEDTRFVNGVLGTFARKRKNREDKT
ncbi:MAG: transcription antitermination factor NusB [Ruminococcus sp.]|nr:transcription antitermination factor NusB [Ruminococcus sp.]